MNRKDSPQIIEPTYSHVFNFEKNYFYPDSQKWFQNNFQYCYYCCIIYVILIFGGKYYMSSRPKFDLKRPLALWSGLLAVFSIIGFCRTAPEMFFTLRHHGFYYSICKPSHLLQDHVSGFWTWVFVLSKVLEFGDTIFIVLRKQPLIFLHFYHHLTVVLFSWFTYVETTAATRWYVVMNYFVHSWMYSYYALKAMQYKVPKDIAMMITTMQLVQMVIGCVATIAAYYYRESCGLECYITRKNFIFGFAIYFSYLILFGKFFFESYLSDKRKNKVGENVHVNRGKECYKPKIG
ncbi:elongation of very long chain fatty acids protein 6-like [Bombus pyrosoma]|uniref:elongation of very long chain fatty acids protein 6-like n=1 Tax=Bombus pyrosoma TaxID=396416 RepID=UPI001CB8F051|nr:elongation of very long chain fatty acids protein 6-like [Bombus pyrosoma]XP_043602009.1 elongation of very long chain fatty acids protein 6-like [Bombus pyrosoma]XP_043602010.1 elongation of very long chain fatty acids protein 6-like [Bombus pyrosoma]XP_043602011.1 elongation of very long chain fatty acids protein 6-like [Bombus pyrosoma]